MFRGWRVTTPTTTNKLMQRALPLREAAEAYLTATQFGHTGRANPWGSPETRPDILQARAMLSGLCPPP